MQLIGISGLTTDYKLLINYKLIFCKLFISALLLYTYYKVLPIVESENLFKT